MKKCIICGKEFKPKKRNAGLCCSSDCAKRYSSAKNRKRPLTAICGYCGREFAVGRDRKGAFCSVYCSSKYYGELRTIQAQERKDAQRREKLLRKLIATIQAVLDDKQYENDCVKKCKECGRTFQAKDKRVCFCSDDCRRRNINRGKDKRIYKNGKADLSITLPKLYKRDGGVCKRCGIVCDWYDIEARADGVLIAGNTYPSIDHIKPIAKGGLHEWGNVQLLCRKCNTKKRDN